MLAAAVDPCIGPITFLCDLASNAAGSAQAAASDYVLGGLGSAFMAAAAQTGELALNALDSTTSIDLGVTWFRSNVAVIETITLPILVGLFVLQVIASVLRREPGGLMRAAVGVGKALLGSALALAATQLALTAVDGICTYIAAASGTTVASAAAQFFDFAGLATATSPALQVLLGLALVVGFILLWGVLLFRKAALILTAVFAPVAFAGSAWDQTRVWTHRWLETVAALVFCKVVVVVTFVVGASAFGRVGPGVDATGSGPAPSGVDGLSDALVGLLLLSIAVFSPWLTWRFVQWSGMEAASVMHSTVAANPISRGARGAANSGRFMAQQALMSTLLGGAGAAGGTARAEASASGAAGSGSPVANPARAGNGASGAPTAPRVPPPRPAVSPPASAQAGPARPPVSSRRAGVR